jgi:hypothetical protein
MSTRCQIQVKTDAAIKGEAKKGIYKALIYRHSDGYPQGPHGVLEFLEPMAKRFFKERGDDATYFIAQYLRQSAIHEQKKWEELAKLNPQNDFMQNPQYSPEFSCLGYGVDFDIHPDIRFLYTVDLTKTGQGTVNVQEL